MRLVREGWLEFRTDGAMTYTPRSSYTMLQRTKLECGGGNLRLTVCVEVDELLATVATQLRRLTLQTAQDLSLAPVSALQPTALFVRRGTSSETPTVEFVRFSVSPTSAFVSMASLRDVRHE